MISFAFWEPVIIISLINVVLVTGLYITAMSGQLSMATAAIAGIGGYVSAVLTTNFDWPFIPAVLAAAAASGFVGASLALVTLKMRDFILKLTTLAFGEAVLVICFNIEYIGGANSFTGIPFYTDLKVVLVLVAISLYIAWRFDGSRLGFAARAVRDDPVAAAAMGVSIARARVLTFGLGAGIVGAGGAVQAHYILIMNPGELGFFISLNYIIFLLFGGMYTMWGPVLAAVVLTGLPEVLRFAKEFRLILYGLSIVIVVLWRPEGLVTRTPTGVPRWYSRFWAATPEPAGADNPGRVGESKADSAN
ncbi:MAG: branched-chain amino acid ABC transporter permease [Proteobacteria bacterium]|nr:branched-chain amino acid ABC transporter permease [Pseudomonadota bacterium]